MRCCSVLHLTISHSLMWEDILTLRKICQNKSFLRLVFFPCNSRSTILSLREKCGKVRVRENLYSGIFYAVELYYLMSINNKRCLLSVASFRSWMVRCHLKILRYIPHIMKYFLKWMELCSIFVDIFLVYFIRH